MSPIKIFVGNIAVGTSSQELSDLFARYGEVTECDILGAGNYAFVHMGSESDGELAIKELNGFALNRSELNIEKSTSATQGRRRKEFPPDLGSGPRQGGRGGGGGGGGGSHRGIPKRSTTKIFVGNIKEGTTNAELKAIFEPHGSVVEADVVGGFGFVHMQSQGEAIKAIKALNGTYLNENRINIELSTEATQGRSRELSDEAGDGFSMVEEFMPRGRLLARGRGHPLMAGRRFHPYDNALGAVPSYRRGLYPAADPYAAAAYASAYGAMDYARDPYALALSAPVLVPRAPRAAPAAAAASGTSDTFARQLLNLYIKDPSSFDKFAKNPLIQESLELDGAQDEEDPYYRPPKEYYEAKSATSTSAFRGSGLDAAYGAGDGYAAIPRRQPLLSVGSSRGLVGAGLPAPRSLSFIGGGALMGHRPLGAPVPRPRLPPPRTANLYTSFE